MINSPRAAMHRVAMVLPRLDLGGMERTVLAQATALRKHHVDVHLIVFRHGGALAGEAAANDIPLHEGGDLTRARDAEQFLVDVGRRLQLTHLHSHTGTWWPASRAARRLGVPHLHTRHGFIEQAGWRAAITEWLAARHTDLVICVSDALRAHSRRTLRVPSHRCVLLRNGIADKAWESATSHVALDASPPSLAMVCRLSAVKNVPLAVRTLAVLRDAWPSITLHVAGDGPERATIATGVRDAGMDAQVHLHGALSDPWSRIPHHAVFIQSSDSEGLSLSLIEAMARGHRVVATDVGETRAFCGTTPGVRIVPPGDRYAMAHAIDDLLRWSPEAIQDARIALQAHARNHGSLTEVVKTLEALYARTGRSA
jgi:glycosyltransferase involved in cell wall biosynthesis